MYTMIKTDKGTGGRKKHNFVIYFKGYFQKRIPRQQEVFFISNIIIDCIKIHQNVMATFP